MCNMPRPRKPYVQRQVTRHGKTVWYFRRGQGKRTRLPDEYGSEEFNKAYDLVYAGTPVEADAPKRQTLAWLVTKYLDSAPFKVLAPETQVSRRNVLKAVCRTGGKLNINSIDRKMIAEGRDRRAETPFAAITYLKTMKQLFDWAVDAAYADENPVIGVKRPKVKTDGFTPWSDEDILKYCKRWPVGTQERLALDIFLFTGVRRSDAPKLGPQHVTDGVIEYRANKNAEMLYIEILPPLQRSIDATEIGTFSFLHVTKMRRPYKSARAFGNWFAKACKEAGVTVRAHGLRKKAAQLLAENGGTNPELKAMFGWRTDQMAAHYTRRANKKKLAKSGASKLMGNSLFPHLETGEG